MKVGSDAWVAAAAAAAGLLGTGRKWERGGNGTAITSTPAGGASPGSGVRRTHRDQVWKRACAVQDGGGGPRWHPASPVTPGEKDTSPPTTSPGRLDCAPDGSGPSLLRGQAQEGKALGLCVSLRCFYFLLCVVFNLELFHRNSGNKDLVFSWCTDVASGVGWALPPFSLRRA